MFGNARTLLNHLNDKCRLIMGRVVETEGVLGGKPRIEGTRVSAEQVYEMHTQKNMSPAEIADILPTVDLDGVKAAIRFMKDRENSEADVIA